MFYRLGQKYSEFPQTTEHAMAGADATEYVRLLYTYSKYLLQPRQSRILLWRDSDYLCYSVDRLFRKLSRVKVTLMVEGNDDAYIRIR